MRSNYLSTLRLLVQTPFKRRIEVLERHKEKYEGRVGEWRRRVAEHEEKMGMLEDTIERLKRKVES